MLRSTEQVLHGLIVARRRVLIVRADDDLIAGTNIVILVVDRVTRADLWPFLFCFSIHKLLG
jgi:hypothetical protein